ncbi:MAG TPA: hypothetical protein VJS43_11340 [Candidatus Acidoferrales bacterium]|nr:hypothetical protein [Candidatus Acidoferrales bacterium]
MRLSAAAIVLCGILFCCGANVRAQMANAGGSAGAGVDRPMLNTVVGEPVSFSVQSEIVQDLAEGTHIDRKSSTNRSFRDLQGRTRLEIYQNTKTPGSGDQVLVQVIITDPVANKGYTLNPKDHTAYETLHPQPRILWAAVPPSSAPVRAVPGVESLGTQTMEGLLVEGTRSTRTLAAGAIGNDRPVTVVTERWVSDELHLPILTKTRNPWTGDQTIRVFDIDRSDPDPSLFEVPPDYAIIQQPQ